MKKNVIALAVAAAMAAPLAAQAEVTVSGQVQAEIVSVSSDTATRPDGIYMQDASIYGSENGHNAGGLFFSASEDLGNGLKALAKVGLNLTNDGVNHGSNRDAYIGLSGGFGTVLAGRMSSPYKTSTVKWDPFLATFMQARGNGGASAGALGHGSYLDNALAYANKFGPVKLVAAVAFDEAKDGAANADSTTGNHAMTFSVNVPVGPVEIALAYLNASDMGTAATLADPGYDATETKVGVKYAAGPITVAAQYEMRDAALQHAYKADGSYAGTNLSATGNTATADGETFMLVTGSYALGATTLSASYGQNSQTFTDAADEDHTYMAVGVKHAFSKATSVHAGYRATTPDTTTARDESLVGVGMRVKF